MGSPQRERKKLTSELEGLLREKNVSGFTSSRDLVSKNTFGQKRLPGKGEEAKKREKLFPGFVTNQGIRRRNLGH